MQKKALATPANSPDTKDAIFYNPDSGVDDIELQRIMEAYHYPILLMRQFIVDFVKVLEHEKHYIYATIMHLPDSKKYFSITRYFDWVLQKTDQRKKVFGRDGYIPATSYDLKSFNERLKSFHCYDEFEIFVFSKVFCRTAIMTLQKVEELYQDFLRDQCETALREDKQIQLTPELIKEYGLTDKDVAIVRKLLNQYNSEAKRKIRREFNALKNLSFLQEKPLSSENSK